MIKVSPIKSLNGTIKVSGAKNAILPILAATLLNNKEVKLNCVPFFKDVEVMIQLLSEIGSDITKNRNLDELSIKTNEILKTEASYELVSKMRASFLILGPLLSRCGEAKLWMPGGCPIGTRPIDLHLKGLSQMGVNVDIEHGCIIAYAPLGKLKGGHVYMDFPSVGATENIMMAAVFAEGETIIYNCAQEPEIVDLANFINSMGGQIDGSGTDTIRIKGVKELMPVEYTVIPDRIEAGTFIIASSIVDSDVLIENIIPAHLKAIIAKIKEMGVYVETMDNSVRIKGSTIRKATDIKTLPYPGFPTDMQAQFMSSLATANGTGVVTETVFENRFMHVEELKKMGANIKTEGRVSIVTGVKELEGARVKATDLRAGAGLIIAALTANGDTEIENEYHIDRGYYKLDDKLKDLGVKLIRTKEE